MKALMQEFLYEKKFIFTSFIIMLLLYIFYLVIFLDAELIIATLSCIGITSLHGSLIYTRKYTNFEKFLISSPLGRKYIVNVAYLSGIIFNTIIVLAFYIFRVIKHTFFYEYLENILVKFNKLSMYIDNNLFLVIFGLGLIANASLLPIYILIDKESKSILNILSICIIILGGLSIIYLIFKLSIFTINVRIFIYFIISWVIYIISYFTTMNLYLNKDL